MSIKKNLEKIEGAIKKSPNTSKPKIIAITKYATDEQIVEAFNLGLRCFGENYVLAALQRRKRLTLQDNENPTNKIEWHLVGHLQKNKVNKAVGNFDLIQSLDSVELAHLISKRAKELSIAQDVLIQINLTGEASKTGFTEAEFKKFSPELINISNIKVRGLMAMGPHTTAGPGPNNIKYMETIFEKMSHIYSRFVSDRGGVLGSEPFELSMGMSDDYELAIKHGSTMIRLGGALFNLS